MDICQTINILMHDLLSEISCKGGAIGTIGVKTKKTSTIYQIINVLL